MSGHLLDVRDGVLEDAAAERLFCWLERLSFSSVHAEGWKSVWRLGGGSPLRGPTWSVDETGECPPGADLPAALRPLARELARSLLAGKARRMVSLTPWIYPAGTGLGLHRDDRAFEGSYAYYLTREWDVHWGGLLGAVEEDPARPAPDRAILDAAGERSSVARTGRGEWVAPVWNRLVIIAPQVRHFISSVDPAAGDRGRISIAGFVHRRMPPGGAARRR